MRNMLFLDDPNVGRLEKRAICDAIDQGYVSTFGPFVPRFEKKFAAYLGAANAVSTQSGTAALHMALLELGIGKGDEVIVPALTFVATVNPVMYVGAKPVFADVDKNTWNIDPEKIETVITKKTRAIIPVHLYGNPCDMDRIMAIAKKYRLRVIEDATESLGAKYKGTHTGMFGDFGCFSFNGNKIITTSGGGMIVGKDTARLGHIKFLVNQARDESREYYHPEVGYNYRMTNIEAAMGLAQMGRVDEFLSKKSRFSQIYGEELKSVEEVCFQAELKGAKSSRWFSCVTLKKKVDIAAFQLKLKKRGVSSRRVFMLITEFSPYKPYGRRCYNNSRYIYENGLCLPSSTMNSEDDIYYACSVIKESIK